MTNTDTLLGIFVTFVFLSFFGDQLALEGNKFIDFLSYALSFVSIMLYILLFAFVFL